uniref:Rho GTPase-activating protein 2 n=1 Tax=Ananas comosus var. bracteatus TaxID=296719 RepID=A0A6V7NFC9_ANACO|nr:unnamed protein product [Ananas comosus var. bracteatus]
MTGVVLVSSGCRGGEGNGGGRRGKREEEEEEEERESQISLLALLLAAIRRSMASSCRLDRATAADNAAVFKGLRRRGMEIGWPTDVRHVAHVTFDRFHGFLGLPVEFELEIPCRVPSASTSVFGVSAESMQCDYDSKGNSVPTILLLMQERLYAQDGLKAEGIFRINAENGQEEHVREQLNKGTVPEDIDVHCLAGLIKAWFRELPEGVLDGLSPEQVLQCNTEEECVELVRLLLPTQAALLNWAVELMADVVEEEEANKMNARNIAMVFSPNMTQMSDPLTALMHAVQVMNLLKTLILKTLREREETAMGEEDYSPYSVSPSYDRQNDDDDDDVDDDDESDDDDYNSEHDMEKSGELREPNSDHEVGVTGESERRVSRDYLAHYSGHVSEDEDGSLRDIEECFLRQLEWKGEEKEVDNVNQGSTCCGQATQSSCSEYTVSASLSLSDGNKGSVSSTSCEVDSETSATEDTRADVEFPPKNVEVQKAVEIIECKSVMEKDSIPCIT